MRLHLYEGARRWRPATEVLDTDAQATSSFFFFFVLFTTLFCLDWNLYKLI